MIRRVVPAILALAAAGILVLLATGVFDVAAGLRADKPRTASSPQARVAERLLGVRSQIAFREALRLMRKTGGDVATRLHRLERAEQILSRLAARGNSRAANLLGLLYVLDALLVRERSQQSLEDAQAAFETAIRTDPRNTDAKYNLELLLALRSNKAQQKGKEGSHASQRGQGGRKHVGLGY